MTRAKNTRKKITPPTVQDADTSTPAVPNTMVDKIPVVPDTAEDASVTEPAAVKLALAVDNSPAPAPEVREDSPQISVGSLLREARTLQGLTIEDICSITKIKQRYLEAIEENAFDALPGSSYAIGFIRAYGVAVNVDDALLIEQYRKVQPASSKRVLREGSDQALNSRATPTKGVVIGSLLLVIAVMAAWMIFQGTRQADVALPPVETTLPSVTAIQPPVMNDTAETDNDITASLSEASASEVRLPQPFPEEAVAVEMETVPATAGSFSLKAVENTWVQVKNASGVVLFEAIMQQGDTYPVPDEEGLSLIAGNGAGLVAVINGADTAPLGKANDVVRITPLTLETVQQRP